MQKILFISHSSGINGAEQCLLTLIGHIDRQKYDPVVVLPGDGPLKMKFDEINVKTVIIPLSPWIPAAGQENLMTDEYLTERCDRLARLIEDEHIDIVQTNTSVVVEGAIAARLSGRPHIWHLHEILNGHPSLRPSIPLFLTYKFIELFSDVVIVVSHAHQRAVSEFVNPKMINCIYNGINRPAGGDDRRSFRKEIGVSENSILISTIGSIVKEKDYSTFIEAAKMVLEQRKDVRFISVGGVGDAELFSSIKEKLCNVGYRKYIQFLGYRNDIWRVLKETDIYVQSSETESYGLAVVEAMAAGKPVVATRCGGPEETVVHDKTGLLVPVKDPDNLANAILTLAVDRDKRQQMGLHGIRRFEKLFTADKYCKTFENLYLELVSQKELSNGEDKFAKSLIELIVQIDANEVLDNIKKMSTLRIANSGYNHFKRYIEIWQTAGLFAANKKLIGALFKRICKADVT